jgi:predicted MFS family arabinose efflux permease
VAADLAVSEGAAGWLVTCFALGYIVGGPPLGALADRRGPRRVLVGALGLFAAANLATAVAPNLWWLLLCRGVAGAAAAGVTPAVYAIVGASAPAARRATWLAVTTSGLLSALAIGAPVGALLASAVGWREVFLGVGALAAVVGVAHRPGPGDVRGHAGRQRVGIPYAARVRAVSTTGLWAVAVYGLYTYLGAGLADRAPGVVAVALAVYGVAAVAGNLAGGVLADRYGGVRVSVTSLATLAALEGALALVIDGDAILVVTLLGLLAVAAYPYFTAHQTRLLAAFPTATAAMLAWNNTALYVGILAGSALGAQVMSVAGSSGEDGRSGFAVLASVLWLAAAVGALVSPWAVTRPAQVSSAAGRASPGPGRPNRSG